MYGSIIYEDEARMNNALGEHGKIRDEVLKFIYNVGLHSRINANGCPIRVVFDLDSNDIVELKKMCNINYWELPNLKERDRICKKMLRYNTNDFDD